MTKNKTGAIVRPINSKPIWILSFITATTALLCLLKYGLELEEQDWTGIWLWIKKTNFNFYFTVLLVFFASFLISRFLYFCIAKFRFHLPLKLPAITWKSVTVILIASVLSLLTNWLFIQQYYELWNVNIQGYPISKVPLGYILMFVAAGVTLIIWAIREHKDCSSYLVKYAYLICLVLTFWALYYPNIFIADYIHGVAATESIFNAADLTPFTYVTTGIYGHYSIFFYLPLKLLGSNIENVVALIALCGCIACACVLYVIHNLMPQNWMRIMAACASIFNLVISRRSNYWQVQPLRILFPAIFMAYVIYLCKRQDDVKTPKNSGDCAYYPKLLTSNAKLYAVPWFLGVLSVLWNTESGIFCLIAFIAFLLTEYWQIYKWYEKRMWRIYAGSIVFVLSSVIGAVALLNIYNLICGGPLVFRTFFFPLQVEDYMIDVLKCDLVWGNHVWIYVLILFFLLLCWGLYHTRWFRGQSANETTEQWSMAPAAVSVAVLGLLSFSYYANRAAFHNLDICFPMAICANALIIGGLWPQFTGRATISFDMSCKKAGVIVCLLVLFGLSVQLLYTPVVMKERHESGQQNTVGLRTDVEQLRGAIPENTYGIGDGISTIYHLLGWDNYGHFRDVPDLPVGGTDALDAMVESVLRYDSFLCGTNSSSSTILNSVLTKDWHYQLEKTIAIQGREYQYYVRYPYAVSAGVDEGSASMYFTFRDDDIYTSINAAVWNTDGGQDDLQWFPLSKNESGVWEGYADLHSFSRTGNYIVQFFSADGNVSDPITETFVEVATLPADQNMEG